MKAEIFGACKAILFDFGGTLDSDGGHWLDRFCHLYETAGLCLSHSQIKRAFYHADDQCCSDPRVNTMGLRPLMEFHVHLQFQALKLNNRGKERELVHTFCSDSEQFLRRNAKLLNRMRNNYRMGLVSNFYGNVSILCEEAQLTELLDVIVDSIQIGVSKPHPEIFHAALEKLELLPEQVIFVGDSYERDMVPARELGMRTIWLKGPNPRLPATAGHLDACISRLPELERLLL
jgi:putative hydrolase of the HAD superfamily